MNKLNILCVSNPGKFTPQKKEEKKLLWLYINILGSEYGPIPYSVNGNSQNERGEQRKHVKIIDKYKKL